MNINLAINQGAKILKRNFVNNSQLDSEILMSKIINKDRNYILLNSNKSLDKKDFNNFKKLIKKRSLGKPVAYLTNKKFFWNSEFFVTSGTLIPRPDTELIVENVLRLTKQSKKKNYFRYWNWIWLYTFINIKREKKILWNWYRYK